STLEVSVSGVADTPTLSVDAAIGIEDSAITLDITSALSDADGSEALSLTVSGIPDGATLSAGTLNADGSVTLTPDQLDGLTITPPSDSSADFNLTVTATSSENGTTATTSSTLEVSVSGVADTPTLAVSSSTGAEDSAIALDITSALSDTDGSETLSLTVTGIPDGATLSAGTLNADGSVTLTPDQLDGLTITPPADFNGTFSIQIKAVSTELDTVTARRAHPALS
ncbi:MAG: hypothetical protein JKY20_03745, partial [Alphaproteobacteria bacterium]|nr:hypothetical protein [Alphaproteobacteria bacterium]